MPTWREKFASLSVVERQEIDKWMAGANNMQQLRQTMEDAMELMRQYEAAGCPDRDQEMP